MAAPRLQLTGISKRYGQTQANSDVALTVAPGEIHALLGENGAGKTTLVKIIYGVVAAGRRHDRLGRRAVAIADPNAARRLGIGMVFQHFSLFETLTVAENIALGLGSRESLPSLSAAHRRGRRRATAWRSTPGRHVHHLSVGERQRVEIVRCLLQRAAPADHGRADLGADAAGGARRCSTCCAGWPPRAAACSTSATSWRRSGAVRRAPRCCAAGAWSAHCDPRETGRSAMAELMIGGALPETRRGAAVPGAACLEVAGLTLPADEPFGTTLRDISLALRDGRDPRHRRRRRQRPEGTAGGAGRRAPAPAARHCPDRRAPPPGMLGSGRSGAGWGWRSFRRSGWGAARWRRCR